MDGGLPGLHSLFLWSPQCFLHPPLLLQPLFVYLAQIKQAGVNKFGNGAGKLLAFHLLQLLPFAPSVRIATTTDPRHDWCGIDGGPITGVVDVVVTIGGVWRLVGGSEGQRHNRNDSACGSTACSCRPHWGVAMW